MTGVVATALAAPTAALAHGISSRSDVPIPGWLYAWGAAIVLAGSFFALAAFWTKPRLENSPERRMLRVPVWLEAVCGAVGVAWFALLIYAGFAGTSVATENILPVFVFVVFWAGLPLVCAVFGDVFRPFNPWRAAGRGCGWFAKSVSRRELPPTFAYPERLGRWPAVAGLVGFGWIELIAPSRTDPSFLATMAVSYALLQMVGMSLFGTKTWLERGDAFTVYFQFFGRMAVLGTREGYLVRRRFLAGLTELQWMPATVTFICATIGITAFDGLSDGSIWASVDRPLQDLFTGAGFRAGVALEISATIGLLACVAAICMIYRFGIWGMSGIATGKGADELSRTFAGSLVPISLAYVVAHYFSLVVFQGQPMWFLISDPLGNGSNVFGTSGYSIDYAVVGSDAIWAVQVAALVSGHVMGLAVAHDKALAVFGQAKAAVRSQYWMLVVMVGFTNLGLWLLSVANQ